MKKLLIFTGYSRGIGAALVENLKQRNEAFQFIYLGRTAPASELLNSGSGDVFLPVDLGKELGTEWTRDFVETLVELKKQEPHLALAGMIYAAGDLGPLGFAKAEPADEARAFYVNAINLAALGRALVPLLCNSTIENFIFHLSSGAALNPYADLAAYSASKAAALMHSRCLALALQEQRKGKGNCLTKVFSVAPGTVETAMTKTLAHSDKEHFPSLQKFRDLLTQNAYQSATKAAAELASLLFDSKKSALREQIDGSYFDLRSL